MVLTVRPQIIVAAAFIAKTERPSKLREMHLVRTAVTEHHSPSQTSEVQLNTPPWHTLIERKLEEESAEGSNTRDKTVRLILNSEAPKQSSCP